MTDTAYTAIDSTSQLLVSIQSAMHRNQKPIVWVDSPAVIHSLVKEISNNCSPRLDYYSIETPQGIKLHSLAISPHSDPVIIDLTGCDPGNSLDQVTALVDTLPPKSVIILPSHSFIKFRAVKQFRSMFSVHWVARSKSTTYSDTVQAVIVGIVLSVVYICSVALILGTSGSAIISIGVFLMLIIAGINVWLDSQDLSKHNKS